MKATKQELIDLQLERAQESLAMAKLALESHFWNSAASELYYTFYYFVCLLFSVHDIDAQTHKGVKTLFAQKFIKENKLDAKWGGIFAKLFECRQQGDYGNFKMTEEVIAPLAKDVEEFKTIVLALLQQAGYKTRNES